MKLNFDYFWCSSFFFSLVDFDEWGIYESDPQQPEDYLQQGKQFLLCGKLTQLYLHAIISISTICVHAMLKSNFSECDS